jgi:hypothetical protein
MSTIPPTTSTARVKERPILFTGEMVQRLLDGSKTQTRRLVKTVPLRGDAVGVRVVGEYPTVVRLTDEGLVWNPNGPFEDAVPFPHPEKCCPYGLPGDQLWVKETFCLAFDTNTCERTGGYHYRADGYEVVHVDDHSRSPWKPSIHMPRAASRIQRELTDVRLERVQEITEQDAIAEGIGVVYGTHWMDTSKRRGFRDLWNGFYGDRDFGWDKNPWIWAMSFKEIKG